MYNFFNIPKDNKVKDGNDISPVRPSLRLAEVRRAGGFRVCSFKCSNLKG